MLFLLIIVAEVLYLTDEINGVDVDINGYIQVEPSWLLDGKAKRRSVVETEEDTSDTDKDNDEKQNTKNIVGTDDGSDANDIGTTKLYKKDKKNIRGAINKDSDKKHNKKTTVGNDNNDDKGTTEPFKKHKKKNSGAGKAKKPIVRPKIKSMDDYFNKMARSGSIYEKMEHSSNLLANKSHYVNEDNSIKEFTEHIYKRSLKALRNIKKQLNTTNLQTRVQEMTDSYKEKFGEFINETQQQKIETSIGKQKVILNILEVSNRMMRTIMNDLKSEIQRKVKKGHLRNNEVSDSKMEHIIKKNFDKQYVHACINLGICRSDHGFSEFLASIINLILINDDDKLKQANDALLEALTYANFKDIIEDNKKLQKKIKYFENLNSPELRTIYQNFRNMLKSGNKVMTVYVEDDKILKKSLALRDLMDIFEQSIPPTTENRQEWKHISRMAEKWSKGKEDKIQHVMKKIVIELLRKGIYRMSNAVTKNVQEKIAVLL